MCVRATLRVWAGTVDCEVPTGPPILSCAALRLPAPAALRCQSASVASRCVLLSLVCRRRAWHIQHVFITLTRLQPEHNPPFIVFLDNAYVITAQARDLGPSTWHSLHACACAYTPLVCYVLVLESATARE